MKSDPCFLSPLPLAGCFGRLVSSLQICASVIVVGAGEETAWPIGDDVGSAGNKYLAGSSARAQASAPSPLHGRSS